MSESYRATSADVIASMNSDDLRFKPHRPPLADFLIVPSGYKGLRNVMSGLGATVIDKPRHEVYLWGFQPGQVLMAGFGVLDGRLERGPLAMSKAPSESGAGSYVILDLSEDATRVSADLQGNHVLYWGPALVTNRLHLAAIVKRTVDVGAALTTAHSNHMFCQQFGTLKTPIAGVSIALPGDRFRVDGGIAAESSRPMPDDFRRLSPRDYRRLIADGAREIARNVESIVDGPNPVICDITGGQDSRVLLAALVAIGRVKDVVFHTKQFSEEEVRLTATVAAGEAIRRKRADVEIANALVARFGGSYHPRSRPTRYEDVSVEENLEYWRSHRFGSYHFMTSNLLRTRVPTFENPNVRMTGGSGELYRAYYQRTFDSVAAERPFDASVISGMLRKRYNEALSEAVFEAIAPYFVHTFANLPGATLGHRLDSHYRSFRNRFHFGMNMSWNMSWPGYELGINPLWSPSLLTAAAGLPEEEKATGRVLFDVTKELCEELPYYPYDTPKHAEWSKSRYHKRSKFDRRPPALPQTTDMPANQQDEPRHGVDFVELCLEIARTSYRRLHQRGDAFGTLCTDSFLHYLEQDLVQKPVRLASWASRLQGFVDYVDIADQ